MQIGMLGDILFQVSDTVVETIKDAQWSGSARYAIHQRHMTNAKTEYTGIDPDQMSFDIVLSAYLGVNPLTDLVKIFNYERNGTPVPLVIGRKIYGKYRWTITQHSAKFDYYDNEGDVSQCTVSISLQEYLNK